jgi:chemotaxis protein CheD
MLPTSKITKNNILPSKYADTAVPALTESLRKINKNNSFLTAKIAGGANMFPNLKANSLNIGEKNVDAVKDALTEKGIKLLAEDVKGTYGRRVTFNVVTGSVGVRNGNGDVKEI